MEALAGVVKETMHSVGFGADSCIAATRIVVDVLKRFDTRAEALTVQVMVVNRAFLERAKREVPPHERYELERWYLESGAYTVGIGVGEAEPGKWPGHLVAVVKREFLVDVTLDQANRPARDILLPPYLVATVSDKFLKGRIDLPIPIASGSGVIYYPFPTDRSYRVSPLWSVKSRTARTVDEVAKRLRVG